MQLHLVVRFLGECYTGKKILYPSRTSRLLVPKHLKDSEKVVQWENEVQREKYMGNIDERK
jgi:hypothetical protein